MEGQHITPKLSELSRLPLQDSSRLFNLGEEFIKILTISSSVSKWLFFALMEIITSVESGYLELFYEDMSFNTTNSYVLY